MIPPPLEPPEELVESLAQELLAMTDIGDMRWAKSEARPILRALGPAIGDAVIRQRVKPLFPHEACEQFYTDEAGMLRALGIEP